MIYATVSFERLHHLPDRLLIRTRRIQVEPGMRERRPAAPVLRVHVGPGAE